MKPDFLSSFPMFSGLTNEDRERILTIAAKKHYKRGEHIFIDGDRALGFFLLLSGLVRVYKVGTDGREQILHIIGPGATFAEGALFDEGTYPASSSALEDSELYFFPRSEFLDLCRRHPDIAISLLRSLAAYLRRLTVVIEDIALRSAPARLASFIIAEVTRAKGVVADGSAFDLDIKKGDLAARLGLVPETLSRAIAALAQRGAIKVSGSRFEVMSARSLRAAATES